MGKPYSKDLRERVVAVVIESGKWCIVVRLSSASRRVTPPRTGPFCGLEYERGIVRKCEALAGRRVSIEVSNRRTPPTQRSVTFAVGPGKAFIDRPKRNNLDSYCLDDRPHTALSVQQNA